MDALLNLGISIIGGLVATILYSERGRILRSLKQKGIPLSIPFYLYCIAFVFALIGLLLTLFSMAFPSLDLVSTHLIVVGAVLYLMGEGIDKIVGR